MRLFPRAGISLIGAAVLALALASAPAQAQVPTCAPGSVPGIGGRCISDIPGVGPVITGVVGGGGGGVPTCAPGQTPGPSNPCIPDASSLPGPSGGPGGVPTCASGTGTPLDGHCLPTCASGTGTPLDGNCLPGTTGGGGGGGGGGGAPSPAALAAVLQMIATQPGLPEPVRYALLAAANDIGNMTPPTGAQLGGFLNSIAQQPGVPPQLASGLEGVAAALGAPAPGGSGGSGGAGGSGSSGSSGGSTVSGYVGPSPFGPGFNPYSPIATGKRDAKGAIATRALVKSLSLSANRRRVNVKVLCPGSARFKCNTAVAVYAGSRLVAGPAAKLITAGKTALYRLRLSAAGIKAIRKGTSLRAVAASSSPYGTAHSAKTLRVKKRKKRR